ncbi:filament-forming protein [Ophiocordyceps camponoti-floridani]|uniref:Filament-forming protein n=1 Tax=Ophiocordyceps camponoti-floridani TaxID=2030778 RepID=A0A8H4QDS3_9HYPO|nr:filament-forming protein [Ophiocordyceps camponoti-floridani]
MAAPEVDVGCVASHLSLDKAVLATLTTAPTVELVSALLQAVAAKAEEFEALSTSKLHTDIALENAVRSAETRSQTSKANTEKALKEMLEARKKLKDEETKRQSAENELQVLRAKSGDHEAEIQSLNNKINTLQSSHSTNLSIIESNSKRDQTVVDELAKQHQRNVELARQNAALQESEQNAKGQLYSAKYREESLKQQLDLARSNAEWLESELKTKSEEALKHRKEKGARIAQLQQENDDARSLTDTLRRSEQQLRERLEAVQVKSDEALVKLQKQEANFSSTVDSYKQELENQRRLVDMSDQLSKKHQERVRDLEAERDRLRDNYDNEIRRIRRELEQEKQNSVALEEKIQQLESELDEVRARLDRGHQPGSQPQTPRPNGSLLGRAASPFGTPASARSKAITTTQALEQVFQLKGQLASEKRRCQQLTENLDGVMLAMEAKAPEVHELQSECDTLRSELAHMSELCQDSFEERDVAKKAARKAENALANALSEAKIYKTQVRDLGTQIQMLVFSVYALEKGEDQLTEEEKFRLEQLAKGEITDEALSDMSELHQFITRKYVVFRDIQSLQAKNEELLRLTRDLANQMESEEVLAARHQAKLDHENSERLQHRVRYLEEEIASAKNTAESYKTERDMFRRIVQQRRGSGDEASMMRTSLDGSQRPPLASIEGDQSEALTEALRKLQSEYDNFRDVHEDVRKDLRKQIDQLSSEKSSLQTERITLQGELRIESERRETLQGNYVALQAENVALQKRSQTLSETAAKQDIRTQQVAEELVEARGMLDSMRNETANLKAEKRLWKDIQDRMSRDNEGLIEEKNRLNNLLATQQTLENERNLVEAEARRKAQEKIEKLERELDETQRKLSSEIVESKNLQLRKEFEAKEAQKRIDDLMTSLSQIREEHVGVKTSRDHLQARVDELTVELRNAEERVGRLQPRPTTRPGSTTMDDGSQQREELESEIRDLNNDISDLKRDLDLAKTKLENALTQVEQYRQLSQSNEEMLEDFRSSQDHYRQEMELLVEEKQAKIVELEQRVSDVSAELSRSNGELSALRDSQSEVSRRQEDERAILQEELNRLREESARHAEAVRHHQQDLRAQADIASKAQLDYEQELLKHAEAAKLAQQLRSEHNELKSLTATLRAEAESAKVALAQSETSWQERRQSLEREMSEIKERRDDVNAQNKLLHQQLEGLATQVAALQQKRAGGDEADNEAMSPVPVGDALEGLRELNGYLRREKEILEVQYDLKSQESKRLQQQLEYVQSQLDEVRLKLDQERTLSAQGGQNVMHQSLMEKLNELNLYRESSATLRNENHQLKDRIAERDKKMQELEAKVRPLQAEIDNLGMSKTYLEEEIKQIQQDRDRWQKRTENILTKYGRVDPAEMDSLKQSIEDLQQERDALKEGEARMQSQVTELTTTLESEREGWQNTRAKLTEQFKERSKRLTGEKNDSIQRCNALQEQLAGASGELEAARKVASDEKAELEKEIRNFRQQVMELHQAAQGHPMQRTPSASSEKLTRLEQRLADARKELEAVTAQKLGAEQELRQLQAALQAATAERDKAISELQEASQKLQAATTAMEQEASKRAAQQTDSEMHQSGGDGSVLSEEEKRVLEEKVAAAEAKVVELEEKAAQAEQTIKERCDKMRDALNNKLKDSRVKNEERLKQKDEELKQKEDNLKLRFEQEKRIWQLENQGAKASNAPEPAPATPVKDAPGQPGPATPATVDFAQLDDAGLRSFMATNPTVKSIFAANLKKRLEVESAKIKGEMEAKIKSAVESQLDTKVATAQLMEAKKSMLRINMFENRLKLAGAKLAVVETAVKETPQRAVSEVWEDVNKMQITDLTVKPAPEPAPATPTTTGDGQLRPEAAPEAGAAAAPEAGEMQPESAPPASGIPVPKTTNPFAVSVSTEPATANPFEPKGAAEADASPASPASPAHQGGGPRSSGIPIPMPRGGSRGRAGTYVPPAQRAASGNQEQAGRKQAAEARVRGQWKRNEKATRKSIVSTDDGLV